MGGARGGADQEPSFLLSTQASSPRLTPTPFGPYSPQELRVPALLPNPSYPLPHRFLPSRVWRLRDPRKKRMVSSIRAPIRMSMAGPPRAPALGLGGLPLRPLLLQGLALQTELLLDLVAEAQSRRLEEQRATFHPPKNPPSLGRALPRPLEDREQLYSTIISHQCQRMEAQRSEPPLPPGGQELLELLLRVQGGGRMEEQRSRPPTHTC
ncbi:hypothetical protein R6Z07F_016767 [Ovis aries]|uniref:G-protein-signaling modulator 3 isoform X1 n=1 Tax=Capra hircus TaxID=9925 RepID=UPI0003AF453F|nr:PREDICTED: G-protein-signaling modulator 3 isoform X1 [Capra hircus]XP_011956295.1 G-protein-signaling modulator 3 isoform X1 [Ovis aries]